MAISEFVQRILDELQDLELIKHRVFNDLVLLSRCGHCHFIGINSLNALHKLRFVIGYDFEEETVELDEERLEILRIYLDESRQSLEMGLRLAALHDPETLITLNNAVSNQGQISAEHGRILQFYHLVYFHNGTCFPHILLQEMLPSITQATDDALRVMGTQPY